MTLFLSIYPPTYLSGYLYRQEQPFLKWYKPTLMAGLDWIWNHLGNSISGYVYEGSSRVLTEEEKPLLNAYNTMPWASVPDGTEQENEECFCTSNHRPAS